MSVAQTTFILSLPQQISLLFFIHITDTQRRMCFYLYALPLNPSVLDQEVKIFRINLMYWTSFFKMLHVRLYWMQKVSVFYSKTTIYCTL